MHVEELDDGYLILRPDHTDVVHLVGDQAEAFTLARDGATNVPERLTAKIRSSPASSPPSAGEAGTLSVSRHGGSGVVIVAYDPADSIGSTVTGGDISNHGGLRYHVFTKDTLPVDSTLVIS